MVETKQAQEPQGDSRPPPSWLNKELIQQALRNAGDSNSHVETIDVSVPVAAGDNYGSSIYRAKATLTYGQERSFIIKGPAAGAALSSATTEARTFEREVTMLAQVIPQMEIAHVASPAIDLVYFLTSSLNDHIHEHHQDLLLREYHCELKQTMELLGLQAPPLEALLSAVDVHGPFSLFIAMGRPILKAEHGLDVNAIFSGDHSCLVPVYELPEVKTWMQRILRDYVRRGWLPA